MFQGLIKQKEKRIWINVKQAIGKKSRGDTSELSLRKFVLEAEDDLIADS